MAETRTHYRLTPYDTWFFRESRPMNSLGGVELSSVPSFESPIGEPVWGECRGSHPERREL